MSEEAAVPGSNDGSDAVPVPPSARGVLTIDLGALADNYTALSAMAAPAGCAGVIKADGYGLGLMPTARALAGAGCEVFFVAALSEARQLRSTLPTATVYLLDGLMPGSAGELAGIDVRPVLCSIEEIEEWAAFCVSSGRKFPAAIQIDTGMNRLGLAPADVPALAARADLLDAFDTSLVMTHLVAGEAVNDPATPAQAALFDQLRAMLPPAPASLSNSAGTLIGGGYRYDLVRPGVALYGAHVIAEQANPMRNVIKLEARILQVRDVGAGETVGYNGTFRAPVPMRIATVAGGYADGLPRALSAPDGEPGLPAMIADHAAPLIGRVSMDVAAYDVTALPAGAAGRGGWAELIGDTVTINDCARRAETIPYEILTRLGRRFHRVYVGR